MSEPQNHYLGLARFLRLEQKVADLEETSELMRDLVRKNNEVIQSILDAIEKEKAG